MKRILATALATMGLLAAAPVATADAHLVALSTAKQVTYNVAHDHCAPGLLWFCNGVEIPAYSVGTVYGHPHQRAMKIVMWNVSAALGYRVVTFRVNVGHYGGVADWWYWVGA